MKIIISILSLLLLFIGCTTPEKKSSSPIITVAVSLPPYTYFVNKIALDTVAVVPIVPAQSNPHLFEPTPKQVQAIQEAQLWIRSHESFEDKILTVLKEQNPNLSIIDLSANLPKEITDRHIWLSPRLAQEQATQIAHALTQLSPHHAAFYQKNLNQFIEELKILDSEITIQLAPFKNKAILTSHPAFGLFCRDYGLIQLSIECEGKDPLPRDLEHTLAQAKIHQIAHILLQPQYNNRGAEMIADHLSLPISTIDPYAHNYIENLRHITQMIVNDTQSQRP